MSEVEGVWAFKNAYGPNKRKEQEQEQSISLGVGQQHLEKDALGKVGRVNVEKTTEPHERPDDASNDERLRGEREEAERAQAASGQADKDIHHRVSRRRHAESETEQFREVFEFETVAPPQSPLLVCCGGWFDRVRGGRHQAPEHLFNSFDNR